MFHLIFLFHILQVVLVYTTDLTERCQQPHTIFESVSPMLFFAFRHDCQIILSRNIIPNQLLDVPVGQTRYHHCEYRNRIMFQWDVKTLAMMIKISDGYELIRIVVNSSFPRTGSWVINPATILGKDKIILLTYGVKKTCHRDITKDILFCYNSSNSNTEIGETEYVLRNGQYSESSYSTIRLPMYVSVRPEIMVSYYDGRNNLWVRHNLNWIYNINVDDIKINKRNRVVVYHIKEMHRSLNVLTSLIYADSAGLVTISCDKVRTECMINYNVLGRVSSLSSICLFKSTSFMWMGVMAIPYNFITKVPTITTPDNNGAYIPLVILAIATLIFISCYILDAFRPQDLDSKALHSVLRLPKRKPKNASKHTVIWKQINQLRKKENTKRVQSHHNGSDSSSDPFESTTIKNVEHPRKEIAVDIDTFRKKEPKIISISSIRSS